MSRVRFPSPAQKYSIKTKRFEVCLDIIAGVFQTRYQPGTKRTYSVLGCFHFGMDFAARGYSSGVPIAMLPTASTLPYRMPALQDHLCQWRGYIGSQSRILCRGCGRSMSRLRPVTFQAACLAPVSSTPRSPRCWRSVILAVRPFAIPRASARHPRNA